MKKAAFYTLGCKVNQYETQSIRELFLNEGYEIVSFEEYADVYVINTCTVTGMSDRKSRQIIRRAKKINPDSLVIVTGCYAQTNPDAVIDIEGVNLILGTKDRKDIIKHIKNITTNDKKSFVEDIMKVHEFEDLKITNYQERTRAYIKIQEGCNQFCSYCIIPYARGPIRSRAEDEVLKETEELVKNGYTEIVYTGIHVASYGIDKGKPGLSHLLKKANEIEGLKRIRLSSIEPMTLNESFVNEIKDCKKLCHHFHLSLQSGCDETLKRMNRKYTTAEYKVIVEGLRKNYPDVAITTDIMVGFPGETEEEFNKTLEFVKEIKFSDAHVFKYSKRNGTVAARRDDQIPPMIKEERSKKLIKLCESLRDEYILSFVGETLEVLFEQEVKGGYFEGKTSNYITVYVKINENLQGQYKNVMIKSVKNGIAYGEIQD